MRLRRSNDTERVEVKKVDVTGRTIQCRYVKEGNRMRMKKKILWVITVASIALMLGGWGNKDMWDTVYTFDRAIINLPDGTVVKGAVEKWRDFEDGDQIQVEIDGKTYLVHSSNVALIVEDKK